MSAPAYSLGPNSVGKTTTDAQGNTYRYDGTKWTQISEGTKNTAPMSIPGQNGNANLASTLTGNSSAAATNSTPKTVQDLINMGYTGYQGWGDASAIQDFKATGGSGKGGPSTASTQSPLQQINDMLQNSFQNLAGQAYEAFGKYQTSNPFNLDQVLAQSLTQAKEQVDPYYDETLSNYLTGVTRQIARSKQDTQNLLGELNAQSSSFSRDTQIKLQQALDTSGQGFADSGLLSSGAALRGSGQVQVSSGNALADYLRQNQYQQTQASLGGTRTLEDIGLTSTMQQRNLAREQYTSEQDTANKIAQNTGQQYVAGFQQTLPPQLQANQGFDLLKQLGIPS
jgi:hypothetical protein